MSGQRFLAGGVEERPVEIEIGRDLIPHGCSTRRTYMSEPLFSGAQLMVFAHRPVMARRPDVRHRDLATKPRIDEDGA